MRSLYRSHVSVRGPSRYDLLYTPVRTLFSGRLPILGCGVPTGWGEPSCSIRNELTRSDPTVAPQHGAGGAFVCGIAVLGSGLPSHGERTSGGGTVPARGRHSARGIGNHAVTPDSRLSKPMRPVERPAQTGGAGPLRNPL